MRGFVGIVFVALGLFGSRAVAEDVPVDDSTPPDGYPVAYTQRPINLRGGMVRIDARFQQSGIRLDTGLGSVNASVSQIAAGGAVGITDRFELSISHMRLTGIDEYRAGAFVYDVAGDYPRNDRVGDVAVAGRFGFLQGRDFDLAGEIGVVLPVDATHDWQFRFGLPARARLAQRFDLDLLPEVVLGFGDDPVTGKSETHLAINLPVSGVMQVHQNVWFAGRSGVYWPDFDLEKLYWPLFLELGGTIANAGRPIVDVAVQGGFPQFLRPGAPTGDALGTVGAEWWVLQLKLQGYLSF